MITYLQGLISASPTKLISYADYMAAALYHPQFGYYMKEKQKIGREGDFITTSNIADIYGRLMAKWFAFICESTELTPAVCEIGAGTGRFAKAFLAEWYESSQTPIQYIIVESSPYHRKLQQELLHPDYAVIQVERLDEINNFTGLVFSNELFDALPVHVIEKKKGKLFELMIGLNDNQLFEEKVPLTNPEILSFLQESNLNIHDHQRIEVPLAMAAQLQDIANVLGRGLVVTVDYGYSNQEWEEPARRKGSLRGYYQHHLMEDVLKLPGEMDITSHIHFDYLIKKGESFNLQLLTKLRQDEFLLKAGILQELANNFDPNPFSAASKRNRAIRSLVMPDGMSPYFHVIIQQKGMNISSDDLFKQ